MLKNLTNKIISLKTAKAVFLSSIICPNVQKLPTIKAMFLSLYVAKEAHNIEYCDGLQNDLLKLCNQEGTFSYAKKSNDKLEIRKGMIISVNTILRNKNMLQFLDKVNRFALKNLRYFEGFFINSFDKDGNYTFSNLNRLDFSEIEFDPAYKEERFVLTLKINSKNIQNSFLLLKILGLPFKI